MKDSNFLIGLMFVLLGLMSITSCAKERGEYIGTYTFEELERGDQSNMNTLKEEVLSKQSKWEKFWEESMGRTTTPTAIDFENEEVIAIGIGTKGTDSYKIQIIQIDEYENELEVMYGVNNPGPNQVVDSTETKPYILLKIEKTDKEITF